MNKFAFCEAVTASSFSPWHIRHLTEQGLKLGGGADTAALCGRVVSWDINSPVNHLLKHACKKCRDEFEALQPATPEVKP